MQTQIPLARLRFLYAAPSQLGHQRCLNRRLVAYFNNVLLNRQLPRVLQGRKVTKDVLSKDIKSETWEKTSLDPNIIERW